jgi:uncharacterized protein YjbJ (UPF0337 family)
MSEHVDEAKGRAKQAAGDLTDDETLKREGKVDRASSSVKDKIDDAAEKVSKTVDDAADKIKSKIRSGSRERN